MSGSAPAGGFEFQSAAFAYVAAHALTETPLGWFDGDTSPPKSVSMETGGPGDDLQVELAQGWRIELQAKKGLSRGSEFRDAIVSLAKGVASDALLAGVLLVDPSASATIRECLRQDILRIADGRLDNLRSETVELLSLFAAEGITDLSIFRRLRIVVKDFSPTGDGRMAATTLLRLVLKREEQAASAWSKLATEGLALCARRGRRDLARMAALLRLDDEFSATTLAGERYRRWTEAVNCDFFVPALNVRLPVDQAWNQLAWLSSEKTTETSKNQSRASSILRYHEWARLGEANLRSGETFDEMVEESSRIVVVGGPGSGKSTLLRQIAFKAARDGQSVLRISLRKVKQLMVGPKTFEESLAAVAAEGSPVQSHIILQILQDCRLLLADGLDETEPQRLAIANALSEWAVAHPDTSICVTTRPIGHHRNLLKGFRDAELLPLTPSASMELAAGLFVSLGGDGSEAKDFKQACGDEKAYGQGSRQAFTLAVKNPLLLTFLIRLFAEGQSITGRRFALYDRILKLIHRSPLNDRDSIDDPGEALARRGLMVLAWKLHCDPGCSRHEAVSFLAESFSPGTLFSLDSVRVSESIARFWEDRRLLERLQVGSEEALTFVHLSLQEFAAALYLQSLPESQLKDWVLRSRRKPEWFEPLSLACANGKHATVMRELLNRDESADPNSTELMICINGLAEVECAGGTLIDDLIARLGSRLASPIPLLSLEASQHLLSVAMSNPILARDICVSHVESSQAWTRFGSVSILIASNCTTAPFKHVRQWCDDQMEIGYGIAKSGWADEETKDLLRELTRRVLPLALKRVFAECSRDAARETADALIQRGGLTMGDFEEIKEILEEHQCEDLTSISRWTQGLRLPDLSSCDLGPERFILKFINLLKSACGTFDLNENGVARTRLPNFVKISNALNYWNRPIQDVIVLVHSCDEPAVLEVLRVMLVACEVKIPDLLAELELALSAEKPNEVVGNLRGLWNEAKHVNWERIRGISVCCGSIARGMVHPSAMIRVAATQIVAAGAGERAAIASSSQALLKHATGHALYCVAFACASIRREKAEQLLIDRVHAEPKDGVQHILQVLGLNPAWPRRTGTRELIYASVGAHDQRIAYSAAWEIEKALVEDVPEMHARLVSALSYWKKNGVTCPDCSKNCADGTCPKCRRQQLSPMVPLIVTMSRWGILGIEELRDLSRSPWTQVREIAIKQTVDRILSDRDVLTSFVKRWNLNGEDLDVLRELTLIPLQKLGEVRQDLLRLRSSNVPEVRLRIVTSLPRFTDRRADFQAFAYEALNDVDPQVRNAAARSARILSSVKD